MTKPTQQEMAKAAMKRLTEEPQLALRLLEPVAAGTHVIVPQDELLKLANELAHYRAIAVAQEE